MKNPFTVCCGISYLNSNMRNPPDAEKLSDDEAKFYIDNLKGSIQLFHFAFKNQKISLPCPLNLKRAVTLF